MDMYQQQPTQQQNPNNWRTMEPQAPPTNPNAKKGGLAIASFVLGLCSFLLICCCGISLITAPLSILFAIVALATRRAHKGLAISGLIFSILTIIVSIWLVIMNVVWVKNIGDVMSDYLKIFEDPNQTFTEYKESGELPDYLKKYAEGEYAEWFSRFDMDIYDIMDELLKSYENGDFDAVVSSSETEITFGGTTTPTESDVDPIIPNDGNYRFSCLPYGILLRPAV